MSRVPWPDDTLPEHVADEFADLGYFSGHAVGCPYAVSNPFDTDYDFGPCDCPEQDA